MLAIPIYELEDSLCIELVSITQFPISPSSAAIPYLLSPKLPTAAFKAVPLPKGVKMPVIEVLGWIWIGILIGSTTAVVWSSKYYSEEISDRDEEISVLKGTREVLKQEIFRLTKPKKRRTYTRRKPKK